MCAGCNLSFAANAVHFRAGAIPYFSVNAAYAGAKLNASVVNGVSGLLKLPAFWQKFPVSPPFSVFQNYS
jgi:hypothetical protein